MMEDEKEKRASFWLICRTLFAIFTVQPPSSLVGTWTESSSNVFLPLYVFFAFFFTCFFRASTHCKSPGGGGGDWVSAFQFAALFSGNLPAMWFRSEWERKRKSENCECVFVCVCVSAMSIYFDSLACFQLQQQQQKHFGPQLPAHAFRCCCTKKTRNKTEGKHLTRFARRRRRGKSTVKTFGTTLTLESTKWVSACVCFALTAGLARLWLHLFLLLEKILLQNCLSSLHINLPADWPISSGVCSIFLRQLAKPRLLFFNCCFFHFHLSPFFIFWCVSFFSLHRFALLNRSNNEIFPPCQYRVFAAAVAAAAAFQKALSYN